MRNELENIVCSPIVTVILLMVMVSTVFKRKTNILNYSSIITMTIGISVTLFIFVLFQLPIAFQLLVCNVGLFVYDLLLWVVV